MTPPHPIDTDVLRKLCGNIDALLELDAKNVLVPHGIGGHARSFLSDARNALPTILDELDRLSAAEAASKARVGKAVLAEREACAKIADREEPRPASWAYTRISNDIRARTHARTEIARLPDAGAKRDAQRYRNLRTIGAAPNGTKHLEDGLVLVAQILDEWIDKRWPDAAPPPPAAADRGVPGQEFSVKIVIKGDKTECQISVPKGMGFNAALSSMSQCRLALEMEIYERKKCPAYKPGHSPMFEARAALATAPKAEDVRRKAIEECARRVRRFQDIVGWQPGESRNELVGDIEDAVRSLAKAAQ